MFCPKCKCLLYPKDDMLICRKCGAAYDPSSAQKPEVITHRARDREMAVLEEISGTLPTADVECPSCGHGKAYWVLRQTRAADEPETRIFRCVNCSHSWREY
ncbi:MAG: transcription factor S [Methanobacteriota archaeon]|nr:MAG: transcription factor S [Euryarchaeota archaeon]